MAIYTGSTTDQYGIPISCFVGLYLLADDTLEDSVTTTVTGLGEFSLESTADCYLISIPIDDNKEALGEIL